MDDTELALMKFGVGQPVLRKEDPTLLRGQGRYTDDINLPGQASRERRDVAHPRSDTTGLESFRPIRNHLTLRRPRSGRLEGWATRTYLWPILRDASLRDAPQDEVIV